VLQVLLRWAQENPEPCDVCWKELRWNDDWVANRDMHAFQGVRLRCKECFDHAQRQTEINREADKRRARAARRQQRSESGSSEGQSSDAGAAP